MSKKVANQMFSPAVPQSSAGMIFKASKRIIPTYHAFALSVGTVIETAAMGAQRRFKSGLTREQGIELAQVIHSELIEQAHERGLTLPPFKTVVYCTPFTRGCVDSQDEKSLLQQLCRLGEQSVNEVSDFVAITSQDDRVYGMDVNPIPEDLASADGFTEFGLPVMLVTEYSQMEALSDALDTIFQDSPTLQVDALCDFIGQCFATKGTPIACALADMELVCFSEFLQGMHFSALGYFVSKLAQARRPFLVYFDRTPVSYSPERGVRVGLPSPATYSVENNGQDLEDLAFEFEELHDEYRRVCITLECTGLEFGAIKVPSQKHTDALVQYLVQDPGFDSVFVEPRLEVEPDASISYATATIHRNTIDTSPIVIVLSLFDDNDQVLGTRWIYLSYSADPSQLSAIAGEVLKNWGTGCQILDVNEIGLSFDTRSRLPEALSESARYSDGNTEGRTLH